MFDAAPSGLILVIAWPAIGYLFLGVFIGLYFGAVPGLSGLVGMAILLPFTFSMEPVPALGFLPGMFAVTTTSDTIASVLLGIPTAASQATILDGYPMAMKGEASPSARRSRSPPSAASWGRSCSACRSPSSSR